MSSEVLGSCAAGWRQAPRSVADAARSVVAALDPQPFTQLCGDEVVRACPHDGGVTRGASGVAVASGRVSRSGVSRVPGRGV
jgi:hypothetical protein